MIMKTDCETDGSFYSTTEDALIVSWRRQQPQLGGILSIRAQSVVQRWDGRWEQLLGQLCAHRDVGRRTPAVSRPRQGRVPESGQGECHAASFFPRLPPPASGAEMQIGDAGGGRGGAGAGWGEVTDSIHRSGHLHRLCCSPLLLGPTSHIYGAQEGS